MYSTKSDLLVVKSAKENCPQVKNKVGEGREDHKTNNNNNNRRKNQRKHNNNNNYNQINLNKIKNITKTTTAVVTKPDEVTSSVVLGGGTAKVTSSIKPSTGDSVINKKHIIVSMGMSGIPITSIATTLTPTTVTTSTSPQATYSLDFLRHVGLQMTAGRYLVATPSLTNSNNNNNNNANNNNQQQQQHQQQTDLNGNGQHYQNSTVISNNNSKESNNGLTTGTATTTTTTLAVAVTPTTISTTTATSAVTTTNNNNNSYQNRNNFQNNQNQTNQQHYMQQHGHTNNNNNYGNYQQHIHTYHQNNNNYHSHNRNHPNMHNGKKYWNYHNNNNIKRNSYNNNNTNSNNNNNNNKYIHITNSNNNYNNNNNLINRKTHNHQARQQQHITSSYGRHTDTNHHVISNSRSPTPSPKSESPPIITKTLQTSKHHQQQHNNNNNQQQQQQLQHNNIPLSLEPLLSLESIHHHSNNSVNGYDSDSSHSSYINNDYIFRSSSLITNNNNNNYQMDFLSSTNLLQNSNDELLLKNLGYYGSHQNLTLYNGNLNHHYSNSVYNNSSESSETGCGVGGINCGGGNGLHITNTNQMQTKKKYSGRSSPQNNNNNGNSINNNSNIGPKMYHRGTKKIQNNNNQSNYRIHGSTGGFHENFLHVHTPPDRFLARAHLVEIKYNHEDLLTGTKWDKLSKSVWDKFVTSQQTEDTYKKKMYLWRYLYIRIKKAFPRFGLYLVGSTISGFGSDTSDVDMCLVTRFVSNIDPRSEAVYTLTDLRNYLISTTGIFEQFHLIQAKVPILRFKDSLHMLEVDLNFNNSVGIRNTHLLHCYSQMDWRLRPLALVVKLWAQNHHINNAKNMTISSYSLVLMVIHFLQCAINPPVLPCLHTMYPDKFQKILEINNIDMNEELEPYYSDNKQTLGELFVSFLEYYSNFDYTQYAISIRTASILPIEDCRQARSIKNDPHQWKQLCIEEPFDLTNTARSVYDGVIFERIKSVFVTSWKTIEETLDLNSVFSQSFLPTGPLHIPMSQQYMPITTTKTIIAQTPSSIGTLTTTSSS